MIQNTIRYLKRIFNFSEINSIRAILPLAPYGSGEKFFTWSNYRGLLPTLAGRDILSPLSLIEPLLGAVIAAP